jgi:hypothetical protein
MDVLELDDLSFPPSLREFQRLLPKDAFRSLLGIAGDANAPTYAELYSGEWRRPRCSGYG